MEAKRISSILIILCIQDTANSNKALTYTLSVRCDTILQNIIWLKEEKTIIVSKDFINTHTYNSVYIKGIANLYKLGCAESVGSMCKVNGWFPGYGCSRYALKQGDKIEWLYTCDLGNDIGGGAWQKDE